MLPKVYIETSVVSYLTARPSRDLVRVAHQQVTQEWWATRDGFETFVSQFVIDEAAAGDAEAAMQRLCVLRDIALLDVTEEAILLAGDLVAGGGLPGKARVDALHVAMATSMEWIFCSRGTASISRMPRHAAQSKICAEPLDSNRRSSARHSNC